jgi:hypothetical protein
MFPKLAAAAVVVVLGAGAFSVLRGGNGTSQPADDLPSLVESREESASLDPIHESPDAAAAPVPTPAAGEAKDAALKLRLPRSGATDLDSMVRHYGFDQKGSYRLQTPSGESVKGTYRDKRLVLVTGGPYQVSTKIEAGVGLIQPRFNGTQLPVEVLIDAPTLNPTLFAEGDLIEFVGIQEGVLDLGIIAPVVRLLGVHNVTTREFYNFEPTTLPVGEVPGVKEAKKAREAAESLKEAEAAKAREAAEKAEADRKAETERKEREDKEWMDSLKNGKPQQSEQDPFSSRSGSSDAGSTPLPADLAAAKAELEKVSSTITSEQARWREALATINRLTVNKTRPVREGSPQYHDCMAASKVIHEVEQGAQALKDRKAALEARVKELEK